MRKDVGRNLLHWRFALKLRKRVGGFFKPERSTRYYTSPKGFYKPPGSEDVQNAQIPWVGWVPLGWVKHGSMRLHLDLPADCIIFEDSRSPGPKRLKMHDKSSMTR